MIKIFIVILLEILIFIPQNESTDFRIEHLLKPNCQPPMRDMDLKNCDMMPLRRLEFNLIPNSEIIDGVVLADQGDNKVCEKFCLNDIRCYGIMTRSTYAHGRCMLFGVGSHYLRSSSLYHTHLLTCCFYNTTIDKMNLKLPEKSCKKFQNIDVYTCQSTIGPHVEWSDLKGYKPNANTELKSFAHPMKEECIYECLHLKNCVMVVFQIELYPGSTELTIAKCSLHSYTNKFTTTSFNYYISFMHCCGSKFLAAETACDSFVTKPGKSCEKFCREKFEMCINDNKLSCYQLCKQCMDICTKAVADNAVTNL